MTGNLVIDDSSLAYSAAGSPATATTTTTWDLANDQVLVLDAPATGIAISLQTTGTPPAGAAYTLIFTQGATSASTMTFSSTFKFPGGVDPTVTASTDAIDIMSFVSDGTSLLGTAALDLQ